ncbi:hypothetical protein K2X33_08190 [bacterium]|nr:hypothetical protein [bacterium]
MRKVLLGVFVLATFAMKPAFGADYQGHEALFGANNNNGILAFSGSSVSWNMNVGYLRNVMPNLQVGLTGNLSVTTATTFEAMAWGYWNFADNYADAIFLGVGAGVKNATTTDFKMAAEIGKRFELAHGLMWKPSVGVTHLFATAATWDVAVNVFNFSYLW